MPRISIQSDYVRGLGGGWGEVARLTVEIRQLIQYRILSVPGVEVILGPTFYELQDILTRLNQEGALLDGDIRELISIADRVDAINGGGFTRPSWLSPGFLMPLSVAGITFSLPLVYRSPRIITTIAQRVYRRRSPFLSTREVNQLARGGTYVNQADLVPDV